MSLRFHRRIGIAPGISLNLGKTGSSLSLGRHDAHVTLGHGGVRETAGVPGTGLSYATTQSTGSAGRRRKKPVTVLRALLCAFVVSAVFAGAGTSTAVATGAFWFVLLGALASNFIPNR